MRLRKGEKSRKLCTLLNVSVITVLHQSSNFLVSVEETDHKFRAANLSGNMYVKTSDLLSYHNASHSFIHSFWCRCAMGNVLETGSLTVCVCVPTSVRGRQQILTQLKIYCAKSKTYLTSTALAIISFNLFLFIT